MHNGLLIEIIPNVICMVHKFTAGRHYVDQLPEQLDGCILHKTYIGETQPRLKIFHVITSIGVMACTTS